MRKILIVVFFCFGLSLLAKERYKINEYVGIKPMAIIISKIKIVENKDFIDHLINIEEQYRYSICFEYYSVLIENSDEVKKGKLYKRNGENQRYASNKAVCDQKEDHFFEFTNK